MNLAHLWHECVRIPTITLGVFVLSIACLLREHTSPIELHECRVTDTICRHGYSAVYTYTQYVIYKDNYGRLNMIGRERENRALIGCDSQCNVTR